MLNEIAYKLSLDVVVYFKTIILNTIYSYIFVNGRFELISFNGVQEPAMSGVSASCRC